jgi:predicted nucleic acid-binding protein
MLGSSDPHLSGNGTFVLDSWPVMEWLKAREPLVNRFELWMEASRRGDIHLVLSTINLGEIYYNAWNEWSETRAEVALASLKALPILIIHPTEEDALSAARIKGRYKISYADAFAAVLALEFDAPVITGDKDFLKIKQDSLLAVEWVGK